MRFVHDDLCSGVHSHGRSNNLGFTATFSDGGERRWEFSTPGFAEGASLKETIPAGPFAGAALFAFLAGAIFLDWQSHCIFCLLLTLAGWYLFSTAVVALFVVVWYGMLRGPHDWKYWHSCEHRVILLMRKGILPDIRSLASMRDYTIACGSVHALVVFTGFLALGLFIMSSSPVLSALNLYIWPVAIATFLGLPFTARPWWQALATPLFAVPMLLQKYGVLRRPTPFHLRHTVRNFNKFLDENPELVALTRAAAGKEHW
ncbi:MAG TPA: hypothetical protein VD862_02295 [Candidatus Paceibacterota bacterium]|nr:hypothetical protein [Candidatus Paceibacterota bacterium]